MSNPSLDIADDFLVKLSMKADWLTVARRIKLASTLSAEGKTNRQATKKTETLQRFICLPN